MRTISEFLSVNVMKSEDAKNAMDQLLVLLVLQLQ